MWLFQLLSWLRRIWLIRFKRTRLATPLVVVGNISLGGTGKTPLLIALVKFLQAQGFKPGVISRGYGGRAPEYPYLLNTGSTAGETGDEPLSIFRRTGCSLCVGPDRVAAARRLEDEGCDILLSDDGLQHYALGRDIEIAVVDGQRALGNGQCLPVGPLRETPARLKSVDWVIINSPNSEGASNDSLAVLANMFTIPMHISACEWVEVYSGNRLAPSAFAGQTLDAVAGIGNPQRFYTSLRQLGIAPIEHDFPDHHAFTREDLAFAGPNTLVMTEKDAVKCQGFAPPGWFYLAVDAVLPESFYQAFLAKIDKIQVSKSADFLPRRG